MKNYVKFNQGNFIKIGKEKNIKVDTIDGTLFDWIRTFMLSGKAMKKVIDNKLYIWVSYKAIREDNPLCHINCNDAVGRRLNKLIELGLLNKFLSKEDGNKTFFCITEFAYTYLLEDRELPTQKSEPLPTQKSDNSKLVYSKLNNKTTNNQTPKTPPRKKPLNFIYPEEFEELWKINRQGDKWNAYKAYYATKSNYTQEQLKQVLDLEAKKTFGRRHTSTVLNGDLDDALLEEQKEVDWSLIS